MKKVFITAFGIAGFLFLCAAPGLAQIYEMSYTGNVFQPPNETQVFASEFAGYVTTVGQLRCQLNFPTWAAGLNVSRLSATVLDNEAGYYVAVALIKVDRWTGSMTQVGRVQTVSESASVQFINLPGAQMTGYGIDNNRFSWYLYAYFGTNSTNLRLYSVTVRFQ